MGGFSRAGKHSSNKAILLIACSAVAIGLPAKARAQAAVAAEQPQVPTVNAPQALPATETAQDTATNQTAPLSDTQEAPTTEIVVTANKRVQRLNDVGFGCCRGWG